MKKILITNDDGIMADGIIRLATAAQKFGEVWVVAPAEQRSAMSHSITLRHAIEVWKAEFPVEGVHAYACDGTPADCVRLGVLNIVPGGPDYVFSGINYGYNIARDLQYSATAGAAFEAEFQGVHSIAFSEDFSPEHEVTDYYLETVITELMDCQAVPGQIYNVNFPGGKLANCKGIKRNVIVSRKMVFRDRYLEEKVDENRTRYMVNGIPSEEAEAGTDLEAIYAGYVTIGMVNNIH